MIIHQPEQKIQDGEITLAAKIEFTKTIPNIPGQLWFSFPEDYAPYINLRMDAFLLGMLIPAMYYQEQIVLTASISPRLAYNLKEFMFIYHKAFGLPLVGIQYPSLEPVQPARSPTAVALGFSGGVDSMYTLYCHLPQNQPIVEARITHGLLVHGYNDFDIALDDLEYFENVHNRYQRLFERLGLTLLTTKTNAYQFSKFRINWSIPQIPTLVAFPYLLSNLIKRFYRAADGDYVVYDQKDPYTMSTHLLSNESLQVVSHTTTAERVDKLSTLSKWDEACENLRVCLNWDKKGVALNCSKCTKCTQTMIMMEVIGVYDKFKVFKQPYPWDTVIRFWWEVYGGSLSLTIIQRYARKYKRYDILFWAYLLHYPRVIKTWVYQQVNKRLSDQSKYKVRQIFFRK